MFFFIFWRNLDTRSIYTVDKKKKVRTFTVLGKGVLLTLSELTIRVCKKKKKKNNMKYKSLFKKICTHIIIQDTDSYKKSLLKRKRNYLLLNK